MKTVKCLILTIAGALFIASCAAPASNSPANANAANKNANSNANSSAAAAAPSKDALMALDKGAYDAWKNKNASFWDSFLAANFIGYGATGRLDRAGAMKEYAGADCDVKSVSFSDDQMTMLGSDAALLTYKVTTDGTCGGQKVPPEAWAASVYVRDGDKWKGAFHADVPATDPNAPAAKAPAAASKPPAAQSPGAASTTTDATTESLMAVEKAAWEAWKNRDAKAVEAPMAKDFISLSSSGRHDRAASIKAWSEPKCEGLSYNFSEPKSVLLGKDAAILTYRADQKGTCDGKPIPPTVWAASFDVKEGDAWKNAGFMEIAQ